jgi:tRNA threonylcarbamoyladenosine biosynthesis protein TsaB
MTILAIDTSMGACSVAVFTAADSRLIASRYEVMERGHAEALAPIVQEVMNDAGRAPGELQRIVVTTGPGTFTGVRIGLSFARGLGLALAIPVAGIDSLRAIAANAAHESGFAVVAAHARNEEAYVAVYNAGGDTLLSPAVMSLSSIPESTPRGARLLGTAADRILQLSARPDLIRSKAGDLPCAAHFGRFAATIAPSQQMPGPLYLRAPDAKPQRNQVELPPRLELINISEAGSDVLAGLHASCFDPPWTRGTFAEFLRTPGAAAVVAMRNGDPVGFLITRNAADEVEIVTIGVSPAVRRQGIARTMVEQHFTRLAANGTRAAFIEVASSNAAARALYKTLGFIEVGRRRGYYQRIGQSNEDAIVMRRTLST